MPHKLKAHTLRPAVLSITGEDAKSYLQSQFSNDIKRTDSHPVTYGLFLDRKGKVLHDAFILELGEESFLLVSYHSPPQALQSKVEENIIADEVEIDDISANYQLVTFWGDREALSSFQPPAKRYTETAGAYTFASRRAATGSVDCLLPLDTPKSWNADPASDDELLAARIDAGFPAIPQDIGSGDLPHEGADLSTAAVSYTKGCYLGQEVMARLHAMGKPQRALYRVSFNTPQNLTTLPVFAGEKEIGSITSHVNGAGLAILKRRYTLGPDELCVGSPQGTELKIIYELSA